LTMQENNPDLRFAIPREGTNLYVDAMCIPKGCEHKENAEAFINFMCSTEAGLANVEETWYSTPLLSVREELDPEVSEDPFAYPDTAFIEEYCEVYTCLPVAIREQYNDEWVRLMNAPG
ncbi:MAG: extracellular solute-binding protein, partial [Oscillospiraceae bacterium]|nr:extracellular solute-binding protein [Oscillospiraceae bacterium]